LRDSLQLLRRKIAGSWNFSFDDELRHCSRSRFLGSRCRVGRILSWRVGIIARQKWDGGVVSGAAFGRILRLVRVAS
jgi:hypothetical protein